MKKILLLVLGFTVLLNLSIHKETASAATPTITYHTYKVKNIKYPVIKGAKYAAVNKKMYNLAKQSYKDHKEVKGWASYYYNNLSCQTKYKTSKKISILCENVQYAGGAHTVEMYKAYNVYNGKVISLKNAFASNQKYVQAQSYALDYILSHPSQYPFGDHSSTIKGHEYYWTNNGMNVVFEPYYLASYAEGVKTVPIPKKYLKY